MKNIFSKKTNRSWLNERIVNSTNVNNNSLSIADIQSANRNFLRRSRRENSAEVSKGLSGGLFKPFFFKGSQDNSIFDSGSRTKGKQKIANFRIKSFNSPEGEKPKDFKESGGVVNLRRTRGRFNLSQTKPISSSFSAGARNVVRNARYGKPVEIVETGLKPVSTISTTKKLEKPLVKSSLQEAKEQIKKISATNSGQKSSFYETYEQQIKVIKREEFLDDAQREEIRKQKEKVRLKREREAEEEKERILKIEQEQRLKRRQRQKQNAVYQKNPKVEEEIKIKIKVNKEAPRERNLTKKSNFIQPVSVFRETSTKHIAPEAKPILDQEEVSRKEILSFFESCKRYFEKETDNGARAVERPAKFARSTVSGATPYQTAFSEERPISLEEEKKLGREFKKKITLKLTAVKAVVQEAFSPKFKRAFAYSSMAALALLILPVAVIVLKGMREKSSIEEFGAAGYGNLKEARASIEQADVERAGKNFELAYGNFLEARKKLDEVGGSPAKILKFVPGISKIESGRKLAQVGENISLAGGELTQAMSLIVNRREDLKNNLLVGFEGTEQESDMSLTDMVVLLDTKLKSAKERVKEANQAAEGIDLDDFSKEEKGKIITLQKSLPEVIEGLDEFSKYTNVFLEILGQNGGRKYLILFQNNHEVRATGGFIGTYGIIKVNQGRLENIKVEGIYNPDGQLKEKIIPPKPIQKMSATWSMHDANWWPDFPTSAEKISWFYEKTGGPTVDGIISLTPKIIQELLGVTGPIKVKGYGPEGSMVIDHENFMEEVQYQVEVDYDKEENTPKKILADMTPLVINEVFSAPPEDWSAILEIFSRALKERSLILYSFDYDIQQLVSDMGWSGEILDTTKDYLSVINTNISGLKTDGAIKQKISHQVEVQDDGSIIDTVTIKRKHEGGHEVYDWYNTTNCNWMRVYVPQGSELISASGFTREFVDPPLDYEKLDFKDDFQVKKMEESYQIDEDSATRIYKEGKKTVFANWVYVSPGETVTVSYKYLLPFRLDLDSIRKPADAYSLLIQKQAGAENVEMESQLVGLDGYEYVYKHPSELEVDQSGWNITGQLATDKFFALVVKKK